MKIETKHKVRNISCRINPAMGIAIGVDRYTYTNKTRRTYNLMILCFVIEVEVTRWKNPRQL